MTHVTCILTAKNRDQLRNPMLGNRVWATFTFFTTINVKYTFSDLQYTAKNTHTHTLFSSPLSRTTRVSRYQKDKTNLDFTEARDSEWQWHQLGHMQVCTSLQTDKHVSIPPLSFLQA